ncbi:hypothetical protein ACFQX6_61135 [Streptosporangium lutulentum]
MTANSASGSKYYNITAPDTTKDPNYGPDPLNPKSHWANSVENQEHVRTYVKVQVRDDKLVVENLRSGTCAAPNAAVELGQEDWCGPNSGASAAQPVGSTVDKVVIHPYGRDDNDHGDDHGDDHGNGHGDDNDHGNGHGNGNDHDHGDDHGDDHGNGHGDDGHWLQ